MATRKQRRRREKEQRHEYVWEDSEGNEIDPVDAVPSAADLARYEGEGRAALERAVVIKLNGGLGTTMGMRQAKSLLPVKDGLSFLDVIARQVLHLRRAHRARVPIVFMNSFRTRADTLAALVRQAAGRLVVMAGGGVREENVREIIAATGVREVHVRLTRLTRGDGPALRDGVKVRKALPPDEASWEETDEARFHRFTAAVASLTD